MEKEEQKNIDFTQVNDEEVMNLAKANFEIYSAKEKEFLHEDEFYELLDSYFKFEKLPSEVFLFKQDDFFHTFIQKDQKKINFDEFLRLFEDFIVYIRMKNHERNPPNRENNNDEFDFDIKFEEDDFKGLI